SRTMGRHSSLHCRTGGKRMRSVLSPSKNLRGRPAALPPTASAGAVHEESTYVRSLIEASLDPLVTISPEGKITDVNEATSKVTGVPRNGLIGTDFSNYFT